MRLTAAEFPVYFRALHKCDPFPWQTRLAAAMLGGNWPETIALPTASGKTAVLDVAVFGLACQAAAHTVPRTMPRRIALVVDRRIVVDEAYHRVLRIRKALIQAQDGILKAVANALLSLGGESPLEAAQLRGGLYREDRWARTPTQPTLLCSTVDQVGSRLLHRGYGLSPGMWPLHAGLLGNDCLIVLDEAHCSEPFRQTLAWIAQYRTRAESPIPAPFRVMTMTATPRGDGASTFKLDAADHAQPDLMARLTAKKTAVLEVCKGKDDEFAKAVEQHLQGVTKLGTTTLVVVNRVGTARAIRERLRHAGSAESVLLTGRSRPWDRDCLLARRRDRLMAGRDRQAVAGKPPLVVVATQCVEVGADFDADALITECCSFDALRQRLGRLDRLGNVGETPVLLLMRENQIGTPESPESDPIYGDTLSRTWHWLCSKRGQEQSLDLGVAALDGMPGQPGLLPADPAARAAELASLVAPTADAPIVFPAYCDLWAQTGPEPAISPDPSIFLHGPSRGEPEVRLAWRADLGEDPQTWADSVSLCPPVSAETLPVPIGIARRWLARRLGNDTGCDLESARTGDDEDDKYRRPEATSEFLTALRWRGPEGSALAMKPDDVRPGDTLVVPTRYGGCDLEGWNPGALETTDIADAARLAARRTAVLRLTPTLPLPASLTKWAEFEAEEWPDDWQDQIRPDLQAAAADARIGQLCTLLLNAGDSIEGHPHPAGKGIVLSCHLRPRAVGTIADFTDEDNTSARASATVLLAEHLSDVAEQARAFVADAGLPQALVEDIVLAARLHDIGKADPRFQAWLAGGDPLRARQRGLLAKSARMPASRSAMIRARMRAGYPEGGRHELLSVRLAESAPDLLTQAHDRDLVLHLIESHHGHGRPFAPVVSDDRPPGVAVPASIANAELRHAGPTHLERLDSGVADRFWTLVRRYGWWGLSYLESCLRLADHRASESPGRPKERTA